jgi:hypothetical protein
MSWRAPNIRRGWPDSSFATSPGHHQAELMRIDGRRRNHRTQAAAMDYHDAVRERQHLVESLGD